MSFLLCFLSIQGQTGNHFVQDLTKDGKAKLHVYLPDVPTGRAIMVCPGGGYVALSMQFEGKDWASYLNRKGIACFVLQYRMPQGDSQRPVQDALHAMRLVRDSAKTWHINPNDVGVMGFSAGGHLASTIATHAGIEERPNFQILFYPVITMNKKRTHGWVENFLGKYHANPDSIAFYSNEKHVKSHVTPPALIILASGDPIVQPVTNSIAYYSALRQAGVLVSLYAFPTSVHGFGFLPSFRFHQQVLECIDDWLQTLPLVQENPIKIACLGDAITFGQGLDMKGETAYPSQLQQVLGDKYEVRNFSSSSGFGQKQYFNSSVWRDLCAFGPQYIILEKDAIDEGKLAFLRKQIKNIAPNTKIYLLSFTNKPGKNLDKIITVEISSTRELQTNSVFINERGAKKIARTIAAQLRLLQ